MYQQIPTVEDTVVTDTLFKKRGHWAKYSSGIILFLSLLLFAQFHKQIFFPSDGIIFYVFYLCTPSLQHILTKLLLLFEELQHVGSRYEDLKLCFKTVLFDNIWDSFHYVIAVFAVIMLCKTPEFALISLVSVVTLGTFQIFVGWSPVEVRKILSHTPSVGTALAWSSYLTYYRRIIPLLKNELLKMEEANIASVPLKKLILIIPSSCDVTGDCEQDGISFSRLINYPETDQFGTINRTMTSCLYKIDCKNQEPLYCVLEKPAPLRTLRKMSLQNKLSSYQRAQQTALFYQQLNALLMDDKSCRNDYLFVKYSDDADLQNLTLPVLIKNKVKEELTRLKEQEIINVDMPN